MIGDKSVYHNVLWYEDEELVDKLNLALLRHKPLMTLETLPVAETLPLCYRAAIDLCYELAARSAPFSITSIEGMMVDKTGVMRNWIQLAETYKDLYLTEINGGLGAEGMIVVGEFTRQSHTTGRQVPYSQTKAFEAPTLTLKEQATGSATLNWTPIRDDDFFCYVVYRKAITATEWTEVTTIYDMLNVEYEDEVAAGSYHYKVQVRRGISIVRTTAYPFNPSQTGYLSTDSNVIAVEVA